MLNDLIDDIKNVFESDLIVQVSEALGGALFFYLDKKNSKFHLSLSYSFSGMQKFHVFSFQVIHKNVQDRQLVISIHLQKGKNISEQSTLFIGRGEKNSKKIYLVKIEPSFSSLSLAKLNKKLFTPFGRKRKLDAFDNVKAKFLMINMNLFLVEEENHAIQEECTYIMNNHWGYCGLNDLYSYSSLQFQYCVFNRENYYVKGSVTKSVDGHKRFGFNKIPSTAKCDRWRRLVKPENDSETRWTKSVGFYCE
ncbi:predicted protein [Naegleria gruberi]|uniref:Predicted protein n=1 Tax=Naegleria gruberi TaxID=5762 RepID=D2VGU2_NAEGR|nr:uncharacterized protein NAEGRDRAFT_68097 [Naegleria gruberi]EFC44028.1 predicted protein [Naegleria gruberi]|eukprot:XP_002676772.1 predicted protein [Naegleria gruberi strain NEG-M]